MKFIVYNTNFNKVHAITLGMLVVVFGIVTFFQGFEIAAVLVVALGIPFEIFILITQVRNKENKK
jgi:hypothetical protein